MKKYKKIMSKKALYLFVILVTLQISCQKLVEVDGPPTSTNSDIVFGTDATATAAMTDLYVRMSQSGISEGSNLMSIALYTGLSGDELVLGPTNTKPSDIAHYQNALSNTVSGIADYWSNTYYMVFVCNSIIESLNKSSTLSPNIKLQLLGEAKFMRAFCYFYLVNIYGKVPLNLSTDYKVNSVQRRSDISKVYDQIIIDLKEAQNLLDENYRNATFSVTEDRVKPNKYAATALLARVYLYVQDYVGAERESTVILSKKPFYDIVPANEVFLKNSKETIWSLQPVRANVNTSDATFFMPGPVPTIYRPVYLSGLLAQRLKKMDKRKIYWIDSVNVGGQKFLFSKKYNAMSLPGVSVTEFPVIMRVAEQYLIRAEARAKQGKILGENSAESDINSILARAGLSNTAAVNQADMLSEVLNERQKEFFLEWGHRWFDLKRLGLANEVLSSIKGSTWQPTDQLYPIPQTEINGNPGIRGDQNPGY